MSTSKALTETRYRKLLENITDTVTVVDPSGKTIWTSATTRQDLGYGAQFWQSENLFNLVHPDDIAAIQGLLGRILTDPGAPVKGEVRLRQPDGTYAHVGFTAVNLVDDADVEGIVITARSIEVEVRDRKNRAETEKELRVAAENQSMFINSVSHEMRSPLHAILGLSEVLARTPELPAESARHVESIMKSSRALRLMIDDLLDFSKMSAGYMELLSEPFSPGSVGDDVLGSLRLAAEQKGLNYVGRIDPAVPRVVLGDPHRLRQLLVNLLSNAIKYTPTGTVELTVGANTDGSVRFSVADTGPGIPAAALPTLYDPYKQARRSDSHKGTGLGLAIAKHLVELMGGTLELETSDSGTTFWCDLTFKQARRASDRQIGSSSLSELTPQVTGLVLVVDDSPVNLMLSSAQLERLGYSVLTAESGAAGLELLDQRIGSNEPIDVVLMDWHMPEMDGLETTARIRSTELESGRKRVPIIAMTASVISGDREKCLAAGMDDYLPKPVSIDDLGAKLGEWLNPQTPKETPADGDSSVGVEQQKLDQLVADLGDKAIVATVIGTFLSELPKWNRELVACIEDSDYDGARRTAHTVKSSAALLGATELSETCAAIEASSGMDDLRLRPNVERFQRNVDQAVTDLEAIKQTLENQ